MKIRKTDNIPFLRIAKVITFFEIKMKKLYQNHIKFKSQY